MITKIKAHSTIVKMKYFVFTLVLFSFIKYGSFMNCKENEIVSKCVNQLCQYTNCSQIDQPIECVQSLSECKRGCICKDKYLRADNGTCIPLYNCPNFGKCKKQNQYYDLCPNSCLSRICGANGTTNCSEIPTVGDPRCLTPTCLCKVGFYRNGDGDCVVPSLCDSNSTINSSLVQTTERQSSETSTLTGYETSYLNESTRECGENEVYEEHPCTKCQPFKCSELGYPLACLQQDYGRRCTLKPGCICARGFVRNARNVCIPIRTCPSCGGDANAESGCRILCQKCENFLNIVIKPCPKICKLNGCGCRRNYLYDTTQRKCVLPNDCFGYSRKFWF